MADTIHSGNGTQRGVIIALVVLVIFIGGIAMLGSGSAPNDGAVMQDGAVPEVEMAPVETAPVATE